ncbi:transcription factor bHLH149-like [Macadamia integrifolia]|uniref:transcription factor bHLH149-like n=1 Tax=Macadamia integrifolia TaxID=60698 RepID=UPI001C4F7EE3|nr:transcription factor bHLH149-like [Macadamia integrifolia]
MSKDSRATPKIVSRIGQLNILPFGNRYNKISILKEYVTSYCIYMGNQLHLSYILICNIVINIEDRWARNLCKVNLDEEAVGQDEVDLDSSSIKKMNVNLAEASVVEEVEGHQHQEPIDVQGNTKDVLSQEGIPPPIPRGTTLPPADLLQVQLRPTLQYPQGHNLALNPKISQTVSSFSLFASMNSKSSSPSSPCPHRAKFTRRFLRALARINKDRPTSSFHQEICRRSRRIKIAADASMASAVGSKRAWSRIMLWRLRNRTRYRALIWSSRVIFWKRKRNDMGNKQRVELSRADRLRRLVPGGEAMDFCNLLDEAAHYIKCLTTQVQVMRNIADFYST